MGKVIYKQTSKEMKSRNVYSIGQTNSKWFIYRYMPLEAFKACLTSGQVRFAEPSTWNDEYEKRFYNADYDTQLKAPANTHPRLFAFCATIEKESEPGWKMYSSCQPAVEIKINRKKWLKALSAVAKQQAIKIYEGQVNYDIKPSHIQILHKATYQKKGTAIPYPVTGHDELFRPFDLDSYLSLLLIKRKAFDYEKEMRYLAIPEVAPQDQFIFFDIAWAEIIEEIRVSTSISLEAYYDLQELLKQKGISPDILSGFDIHKDYHNNDRIIVEL